ncbi:MAG TPA: hypothetical protein VK638_28565 [Edaphobacter sp.]|nr:hypothetical protein [Edaphobacter sp.]
MLKQRRENRIVNCLVCWTCHGRMGPNHFTLKDGGAVCGLCEAKNPLGNLRKMSIQEVTEPSEIIVCFARGGVAAHALHIDCKTALGPWITFASAETLEKALRYLGATDAQIAAHRKDMSQCGQGSSHIRLVPNGKNLLRIDWDKL